MIQLLVYIALEVCSLTTELYTEAAQLAVFKNKRVCVHVPCDTVEMYVHVYMYNIKHYLLDNFLLLSSIPRTNKVILTHHKSKVVDLKVKVRVHM